MGFSLNSFFEGMSGMKKMSYGGDLYDPAEAKRLRERKEKLYGELGTSRDRYGKQAGKFLDTYGTEGKKAEKFYGASADALGRSETALRRGEADVSRSRRYQRSADAMIGDRTFYGDLKKRSTERRKAYKDAQLEQQALRGRVGQAQGPGAFSQSIMDAFKTVSDSARQQMAPRMAEMKKTNPVAAAKMMMDFDKQTMQGLGQAQQKGFFGDRDINMQNLAMEEGMLMRGTGMLGAQAQEDQYMNQYQQQQIANYGAAGAQALQTAGAEQGAAGLEANIARGQMAIGGQYDQRARDALGAGMQYEGMGYGALQDQTSMTRADLDRQAQFQLSDRAARARVDQYNAGRRSAGLSNVLKIGSMAIGGYGALAGAALNKAQADYYNRQGGTGGIDGTGGATNVDTSLINYEGNAMGPEGGGNTLPDLGGSTATGLLPQSQLPSAPPFVGSNTGSGRPFGTSSNMNFNFSRPSSRRGLTSFQQDPYQTMYTSSGLHPGGNMNSGNFMGRGNRSLYIPQGGSGLPGSEGRVASGVQMYGDFMNRKSNKGWRIKGSGLPWGHGRAMK